MQILARYIAEIFVKNLVLSLFGLASLFFFQTLITQLNDYPFAQLFVLTSYDFPQMLVMVAPPATLMATTLTLSGLSKTSELVAIFSIGIGLRQIMSILLPIVFVLSCISLIAQDRILPLFFEKRTIFYWRDVMKKQDFYLDVNQQKIWYRSDKYIYNIKTFDPKTNRIVGVGVYSFDPDFDIKEVIQADEANYQNQQWILAKGKVTHFDDKTGYPIVNTFENKPLPIKEAPKDFKMIEQEVDRLRIKDLIRFIELNKKSGIDSKTYEVKLHSRFSLSFIPIVMALLALPFSVSHHREGKMGRDLMIAFAITFVYWLSFSAGLSLGRNGSLPPALAAWLPSVGFGALAIFLITRQKR